MSGFALFNGEEIEGLPKPFAKIYYEIEGIFRRWTSDDRFEPIILELGNRHSTFTFFDNATGVFWCNRLNREIPEGPAQKDLAGEDLPFYAEMKVAFTLDMVGEEDGLVSISVSVQDAELAEPAVRLAEILEEHMKSWLPSTLVFPAKVLVSRPFKSVSNSNAKSRIRFSKWF